MDKLDTNDNLFLTWNLEIGEKSESNGKLEENGYFLHVVSRSNT